MFHILLNLPFFYYLGTWFQKSKEELKAFKERKEQAMAEKMYFVIKGGPKNHLERSNNIKEGSFNFHFRILWNKKETRYFWLKLQDISLIWTNVSTEKNFK